MVMKTGREWLLVESSKLQDRRQWNCMICNLTVESAELSDHNMSMNVDMSERFSSIPGYTRPRRICDIYDFFAPFINLLNYLHRSIRWYGAARRRHLPTDIHSLHKVFTVMHPATYVTCQPISAGRCSISRLYSAMCRDLTVPVTMTIKYSPRSFAVCGPTIWNSQVNTELYIRAYQHIRSLGTL